MKRTYIIALALLLLATLPSVARQAEELLTSGDYEYRILEDGTAEIAGYSGSAEVLEVPGSLDGFTVTSIGDEVFYHCSSLLDITIPNSVVSIGSKAFSWCENLKGITIPNNVTDIGNNPFAGCVRLNQIVVRPDHPTLATIDGVLFSKADKRLVWYPMAREDTTYRVPQGVLSIGDSAFYRCESLRSIILPNSVKSIGNEAFSECKSLSNITLPDSVTSVGNGAFFRCSNLTGITLPDSVTSIGGGAFFRCSNLTEINLPGSITNIGDNPFQGCENLNRVVVCPDHPALATIDGVLFSKTDKRLIWYPMVREDTAYEIPQGILIIGYEAFGSCSNLRDITVSNSVTNIGDWAFCGCENLTGIALPDSVTSIGDGAFFWCENLTSITIPNSVTSIGDVAFKACSSLISITIPESVTSIGDRAFVGCNSLTKIIITPDSYAQKYCEENGLPFVYQENTDWLNE
ncbi:MAG: leucine-rich repeat domain-containing protein [Christensenellales bacterium]|jgi:hypothetical protein